MFYFKQHIKNHSKNTRLVTTMYFIDIKAFVSFALKIINLIMPSGRKSVTNSLPASLALPKSRVLGTNTMQAGITPKPEIPQIIDLAGFTI